MEFNNTIISGIEKIFLALIATFVTRNLADKCERYKIGSSQQIIIIFTGYLCLKFIPQFFVNLLINFLFICSVFIVFTAILKHIPAYILNYPNTTKNEILITFLLVVTISFSLSFYNPIYFLRVKDTGKQVNNSSIPFRNTAISEIKFNEMVLKYDFFDKLRNQKGRFVGGYEKNDNLTIIQKASGLMWELEGSSKKVTWNNAKSHIQNLNSSKFAEFNDWRIPTIKELSSLMENNDSGLYISNLFSENHAFCWSCNTVELDQYDGWYANFKIGQCLSAPISIKFYVKAVRTCFEQSEL